MPSRKYRNKSKKCNNRTNKRRNKRNSKRCITRKRRGGGCGCGMMQQQGPPIPQPPRTIGGSPYLNQVPQYAVYPYNADLKLDPQNPAAVADARFMGDYSRMAGGRRRRGRGRKIRGGSNFFANLYTQLANSGSGMNYVNSFGAINGSTNQSALVTGTGGMVNGNASSQPVLEQPYGHSNPPLA